MIQEPRRNVSCSFGTVGHLGQEPRGQLTSHVLNAAAAVGIPIILFLFGPKSSLDGIDSGQGNGGQHAIEAIVRMFLEAHPPLVAGDSFDGGSPIGEFSFQRSQRYDALGELTLAVEGLFGKKLGPKGASRSTEHEVGNGHVLEKGILVEGSRVEDSHETVVEQRKGNHDGQEIDPRLDDPGNGLVVVIHAHGLHGGAGHFVHFSFAKNVVEGVLVVLFGVFAGLSLLHLTEFGVLVQARSSRCRGSRTAGQVDRDFRGSHRGRRIVGSFAPRALSLSSLLATTRSIAASGHAAALALAVVVVLEALAADAAMVVAVALDEGILDPSKASLLGRTGASAAARVRHANGIGGLSRKRHGHVSLFVVVGILAAAHAQALGRASLLFALFAFLFLQSSLDFVEPKILVLVAAVVFLVVLVTLDDADPTTNRLQKLALAATTVPSIVVRQVVFVFFEPKIQDRHLELYCTV